jgi:hypothetical protein
MLLTCTALLMTFWHSTSFGKDEMQAQCSYTKTPWLGLQVATAFPIVQAL